MAHALSPDMISGDHSRIFVKDFFDRCGETSPINKTLQIDTEIMLVDDPVKRVDNMTMAFGLETRVPFLDHEMVELATRIPSELKVKSGGKHILKEAARRILPPEWWTGRRAISRCRRSNTSAAPISISRGTC